jgi:DNA-binding NtrC family response regulator
MTLSETTSLRILIADDQADVREALRLLLKGEGFQTDAVSSPRGAMGALEKASFDALLMDLNYTRDTTSGHEGLDLLAHVQSLDPTLPVIVMTAWATVELAVEAMRRGVHDFVKNLGKTRDWSRRCARKSCWVGPSDTRNDSKPRIVYCVRTMFLR